MQRYVVWLGGAVGLAMGIRWAMLTPPHPNCEGADGFCTLQHVYAAQFTKVAASVIGFFLLGSLFVYSLPEWLDRRAEERRGRAWIAENRLREAGRRVPLSRDDARKHLQAAAPPVLPAAAVTALLRAPGTPRVATPALRPRGVTAAAPAATVAAEPIADASLGLPAAALAALRASDAATAPEVSMPPTRRFARAEPALRPRRVA